MGGGFSKCVSAVVRFVVPVARIAMAILSGSPLGLLLNASLLAVNVVRPKMPGIVGVVLTVAASQAQSIEAVGSSGLTQGGALTADATRVVTAAAVAGASAIDPKAGAAIGLGLGLQSLDSLQGMATLEVIASASSTISHVLILCDENTAAELLGNIGVIAGTMHDFQQTLHQLNVDATSDAANLQRIVDGAAEEVHSLASERTLHFKEENNNALAMNIDATDFSASSLKSARADGKDRLLSVSTGVDPLRGGSGQSTTPLTDPHHYWKQFRAPGIIDDFVTSVLQPTFPGAPTLTLHATATSTMQLAESLGVKALYSDLTQKTYGLSGRPNLLTQVQHASAFAALETIMLDHTVVGALSRFPSSVGVPPAQPPTSDLRTTVQVTTVAGKPSAANVSIGKPVQLTENLLAHFSADLHSRVSVSLVSLDPTTKQPSSDLGVSLQLFDSVTRKFQPDISVHGSAHGKSYSITAGTGVSGPAGKLTLDPRSWWKAARTSPYAEFNMVWKIDDTLSLGVGGRIFTSPLRMVESAVTVTIYIKSDASAAGYVAHSIPIAVPGLGSAPDVRIDPHLLPGSGGNGSLQEPKIPMPTAFSEIKTNPTIGSMINRNLAELRRQHGIEPNVKNAWKEARYRLETTQKAQQRQYTLNFKAQPSQNNRNHRPQRR